MSDIIADARLYHTSGPTGRLIHDLANEVEQLRTERALLAKAWDDRWRHNLSSAEYQRAELIRRHVLAKEGPTLPPLSEMRYMTPEEQAEFDAMSPKPSPLPKPLREVKP